MKRLFFGRKTKLEWRDSCPETEDLLQSYLRHAWGPKLWIGISFANKRMKWTIIPQRSMSRFLSTYHFSIHFPILSKNSVPQPLLLKNPRKLSLRFWCFLLACQVPRVPSSNPWHDQHTWRLVWKLWSQAISDSFWRKLRSWYPRCWGFTGCIAWYMATNKNPGSNSFTEETWRQKQIHKG